MKFITSLNPNGRIERQTYCLNNWKSYGLPVCAIQHHSEQDCKLHFPQVDEWIFVPYTPTPFNTIFPHIDHFVAQYPGIIINSDIHLNWSLQQLQSFLKANDPVVGIRNENGIINRYGIDVFIAKQFSLPENEFHIGKPGWDYLLLIEMHKAGLFHTVTYGVCHEPHQDRWNPEELRIAQNLLATRYNCRPKNVTHLVQRITGRA